MKTLILAGTALIAAASATGASAASIESVSHSKQAAIGEAKLDYTSTYRADGVLKLSGTETRSGKRFDFRVSRNGYVSGTVDRKAVSFFVPAEQRDRAVEQLARRMAGNDTQLAAGGSK